MLADLFDDPNNSGGKSYKSASNKGGSKPPSNRKEVNLCGIINQGATCYLNTLIQTLFYTKNFRENIFSLSAEELGLTTQKNGQPGKQRIILIELQRLFAQLLLLDQDACSTNKLTDSFGWSNNEEMQQHDVQELNRILFSAIEQSLVNTKQSKLIQELYRGTYVNKIKCLNCLNIVEREEEFLDLQITVQGSSGVDESLLSSFVQKEQLNGSNQYKCGKCNNQYQDAEKYCQLKTLPPVLTLSLLRFTYDLRTYQRIKETGRFEFPLELDLAEFMEDSIKQSHTKLNTEYELYSIIIHSGSAYGGHYHNFIRDLDNLGNWTLAEDYKKFREQSAITSENQSPVYENQAVLSPEFNDLLTPIQEICLICTEDTEYRESSNKDKENEPLVNLDYIKYERPLDLLKAYIYNKYKYDNVRIDSICSDLTKTTGMSWNKRFKSKYGTIEKFLRKNDSTFSVSADSRFVNLKPHDRINIVSSRMYGSESASELIGSCLKEVDEVKCLEATSSKGQTPLKLGKLSEEDEAELSDIHRTRWFDCDDSRITPIFTSAIRREFEGKESAYMLFYRRKGDQAPDSQHELHSWLLQEIRDQNEALSRARNEYEISLNSHKVDCYLDTDFYLEKCILNLNHQSENKQFSIFIDKRGVTLTELRESLVKQCIEPSTDSDVQARRESCLTLLLDDSVPFYWLLAKRANMASSGGGERLGYYVKGVLVNANLHSQLTSENDLFLILSHQCEKWPMGEDFEPVRLVFKFFDKNLQMKEISYTFVRSTLVSDVRREMSSFLVNEQTDYELGLTNEEINRMALDYNYAFSLIRSYRKSENDKTVLEPSVYDNKTLKELSIKNGDFITIESDANMNELFSTIRPASAVQTVVYTNKLYKVNIVNCINNNEADSAINFSSVEVNAEESELISNIKLMAISALANAAHVDSQNCHLRFINENSESIDELRMLHFVGEFADSLSLNKEASADDGKQTTALIHTAYSLLGTCLYDDSVLGELVRPVVAKSTDALDQEQKFLFLLCSERAPVKAKSECVIKCYRENANSTKLDSTDSQPVEILVNLLSTKIIDLTSQIVSKMNLEALSDEAAKNGECYYLKKLDWLGDVDAVLNNVSQTCAEANLDHNQSLVVTKGKLVPPHHYKIKLWLKENAESNSDQLSINHMIEHKFKEFKELSEIIVSNEIKLEDLKFLIQTILLDNFEGAGQYESLEHLRLRLMRKVFDESTNMLTEKPKFQLKKVLFDWHKPLKQLGMVQETDLCIQVFNDEPVSINQGIILLDCVRANLTTKLCASDTYRQIAWNVNNGDTLISLRESIYKAYADQLEPSDVFRLAIAKRLVNKFQWILIKEISNNSEKPHNQPINCNNNANSGGKHKKKKHSASAQQQTGAAQGANKCNLRVAPYHLDDGDVIAFTLPMSSEPVTAQDFMSFEDLEITKKSNITKAELNRLIKDRKNGSEGGGKRKGASRPEVGITIKIDNFN